jgi:RND superfamily putative drug exporter
VNGLGEAFPGLGETAGYRAAAANLAGLRAAVAQVRAGLQVGTQLNFIAAAIASGSGQTEQATLLPILQGYLGDLANAYPEVVGTGAYQSAVAALDEMASGIDPALTSRLRDSLVGLAGDFGDRPDAYLISQALTASAQSQVLVGQLTALNERLPGEIEALAGQFGGETIDLFLPSGITGESGDQLAQLERGYLSSDREVTRLVVTLSGDPYSNQAIDSVVEMRSAIHGEAAAYGEGARVLVGGNTAAFADIRKTIGEDFLRVATITVAGIFLVLVLLLRAIVAPLYLVATVLLSWAGSLGLATLLFQNALGHSGVNYFLPLIVFVLLVAIGSDYNIFLMSRVREESGRYPIREAIQVASARTGTVITSAGIILAGTFAAMAIAPLRLMLQIGVAVALGVVVDTFVVRTLLVPAITAWLGHWAWWPWHKARPDKGSHVEG